MCVHFNSKISTPFQPRVFCSVFSLWTTAYDRNVSWLRAYVTEGRCRQFIFGDCGGNQYRFEGTRKSAGGFVPRKGTAFLLLL